MKFKAIIMSLAAIVMVFTACDDSKKKDAEAATLAEAQKMEMEAQLKAEEDAKMAKMEFENNTIAALAMGNENFSGLVHHLQAADLAETFKGEGEYTVFAPTNEAFNKVPKATMDNLMKPENKETLQGLLKYHVVSGEWKAADLVKAINDNNNKYTVTTLQGDNLTLSLKDGKVQIKDSKGAIATVVTADIDASNGVIHTIDKVVMPKQ
ncbi:fasciclin domain-containing protein [Ulvibacter sp. MAR_2010_11]|uniref:fasciclin domain-containing protein n=1 Tax=Ulvibacter sp. MAR_2010_11 TaxID=1250229 RepID=UPI001E3FD783|nr:fasciclin domain-containing protein [Ulvibacter sp. MAR_2010_11]